jgi:hypothetical protein
MAEKKSILEEALLDIKNIQSALNANTKEILRSVAKEEIDSVVKESLMKNEADYEEEDLESTDDAVKLGDEADMDTVELGGEESEDELGDIEGSEEVAPEMAPEIGMDSDELGGVYDMTKGASDDDVFAIYKKLSGEDEIEIVGDEIHLNITEPGEYIVKKGALGDSMEAEEELDLEDSEEESEEEGEMNYEIEMGNEEEEESEEEESEEEESEEEESEEEEELEEVAKVGGKVKYVGGSKTNEKLKDDSFIHEATKARQIVSETTKKYNTLLTEAKKLQTENEEFRKALKTFRNQLVETVVFNSNLTYVTRLFMEHSTTKAEKQNIIKRFDVEVSNLVESKKLYKTIANELESRKPIAESVNNKIIKEAATSTSKQLNESTAYVDPSTKRILDLINRVEKK